MLQMLKNAGCMTAEDILQTYSQRLFFCLVLVNLSPVEMDKIKIRAAN